LYDVIVEITSGGPAADDRRFQEQIRHAAESAPSLIAEGFTRLRQLEEEEAKRRRRR
jgi:four helix bundle protein